MWVRVSQAVRYYALQARYCTCFRVWQNRLGQYPAAGPAEPEAEEQEAKRFGAEGQLTVLPAQPPGGLFLCFADCPCNNKRFPACGQVWLALLFPFVLEQEHGQRPFVDRSLFSMVAHRSMRKPCGLLSERETLRRKPSVMRLRVSTEEARVSRWRA